MADYVQELNSILSSADRKLLKSAGVVSSTIAKEKAKVEYKKYKAKTLEQVEEEYLKTINTVGTQAKKESRRKG